MNFALVIADILDNGQCSAYPEKAIFQHRNGSWDVLEARVDESDETYEAYISSMVFMVYTCDSGIF